MKENQGESRRENILKGSQGGKRFSTQKKKTGKKLNLEISDWVEEN